MLNLVVSLGLTALGVAHSILAMVEIAGKACHLDNMAGKWPQKAAWYSTQDNDARAYQGRPWAGTLRDLCLNPRSDS
jgi:hypothetical protein